MTDRGSAETIVPSSPSRPTAGPPGAAHLGPDGPDIIPNALGGRLTPSVVGVDQSGTVVVGAARELQVVRPDRCAALFKRLMGTDRTVALGGKPFTPPRS